MIGMFGRGIKTLEASDLGRSRETSLLNMRIVGSSLASLSKPSGYMLQLQVAVLGKAQRTRARHDEGTCTLQACTGSKLSKRCNEINLSSSTLAKIFFGVQNCLKRKLHNHLLPRRYMATETNGSCEPKLLLQSSAEIF